ncbi:MAG: PAS domain S-box protein, partial [Candidatus Sumerlaeota bacterium]|nr:PAS domain S-box protein [Candidatus Sumerlaeota bacterium]
CANCPAFKEIQTGQSEHKIVQTPDGRIWDEGGEPVFDRAGNVIAVVEIAQDITGRRQAEEALRALSSRQQALLTAIPDIIVEVDKNKVITWVNPVGLEFYGEDVLGKEAAFYFEGEQDTYSNIAPLFDGNEDVIYIESWQWRKDGKKRLLAWWCQVLKDAGGNVIGAISTARDITERKREEEALRETNAYLENLINYANAPIIVWDPQFRITRFNHAFEFLSGRTEAEVLGQSLELLFPPALREHSMALIRQTLSGQRWEVVEIKIQHQDGSERIVLWNSATLFAPEGQTPLATIAQGQDITDRKRAAAEREQLEAQNWQLQKSESLGRMAGAIAHHFNNQLQGVMGYLELAMNVLPKNAGHGKYMTGAMQSACKAAEMSTQMLTYLGQTIAKHEPLDFSDACRRSLSLLGAVMPQNVFLETNFSSPGPVICANSNQIQQLVTNLVTNAWEAMGEVRCVIRLTVETVSASDIPSAQHVPIDWQPQDSAYACLEVADAGCGIATQDIDKIFDPFFSSKFPGRGMGLAVVLGIVRAHHGVVTVESEPARGSVFRVFVPVLTAPLSCCAEGEHGQARTSTDKHGQTRTNTDEHG